MTLAAFVVIAMLEDVSDPELSTVRTSLQSTIQYLENQYTEISKNPYSLSIVSYALELSGSSKVDQLLAALEAMQQSDGKFIILSLFLLMKTVTVVIHYISHHPSLFICLYFGPD